jgi:hypothetical protein
MSDFANSESVVLKGVTLDFFDIFKPGKPMKEGGQWKYKIKVILARDSEAAAVAKKAMGQAAKALWGDNAANVVPMITANSKALRDGNGNLDANGAVRPEYKDMLFVSASNASKPQVVGPQRVNNKFVTILEDGRCSIDGVVQETPPYKITVPYRGCKVNVKVQFTAGKSKKLPSGEQLPNQIFAKLEAVQFVADGTPFGAGPTSAEGFEDEEMAASEVGSSDDGLF